MFTSNSKASDFVLVNPFPFYTLPKPCVPNSLWHGGADHLYCYKAETCRPDTLFLLYIKQSVVLLTDTLYLYPCWFSYSIPPLPTRTKGANVSI